MIVILHRDSMRWVQFERMSTSREYIAGSKKQYPTYFLPRKDPGAQIEIRVRCNTCFSPEPKTRMVYLPTVSHFKLGPQHLHILLTTLNFSARPRSGFSRSAMSSRNPSRMCDEAGSCVSAKNRSRVTASRSSPEVKAEY